MKSIFVPLSLVFLTTLSAAAQNPEVKFVADTLVVQAEGSYEADPDVATLEFSISTQEKELKRAYDTATQSMRRIVDLAERNGLKKEEVSTGVLTVVPQYKGDRNRKTRSYFVNGKVVLRVRDFPKIGAILDDAIQDGITEFRSLTYSLGDEEAAKQRAVAEAMRRAIGRATVALEQKGQRLGTLRSASLDVKQLVGVARLEAFGLAETVEVSSGGWFSSSKRAVPPPPPPVAQPEKITVQASVQCVFQIQ